MALAPAFLSHRVLGSSAASHTLEVYLDFTCPFSAKQLRGVKGLLIPALQEKGKDVAIIIRQAPQPWHHSSTFVHQTAIAVASHLRPASPSDFFKFACALMEVQAEYFDEPTVDETPNQTKARLAEFTSRTLPGVSKEQVLELIKSGKGNSGTKVDKELKLAVRYARQNGVHVTPTVALDGVIDPSVSSSFTRDDWCKYIDEKLV